MSAWLHALPVVWMGVVILGATYLVTLGIYALVTALAVGERARAFKAISPGMLPPLGIIFGLLVAFIAAQVWGDLDRAHAAVNREASALRAVVLLSASFPGEPEQNLRALVRRARRLDDDLPVGRVGSRHVQARECLRRRGEAQVFRLARRGCDDGHVFTSPVRAFPANAFGVYDATGNVLEWTEDCFVEGGYAGAPADGTARTSAGCELRVIRGGSWLNGSRGLRAAMRDRDRQGDRYTNVGFRVARE